MAMSEAPSAPPTPLAPARTRGTVLTALADPQALTEGSTPAIRCPFPAALHPGAREIDDHLLEWARGWDLVRGPEAARRFHAAGFGRFAASVYPRARRLALVAEWQGHNWLVDDQLDEGTEAAPEDRIRLARRLLDQLTPDLSPRRPTGPLTAALGDLWQRTARPFSRAWRERYVAHYRDFLACTVLPAARPAAAGGRELTPYVRRRRLNSGCEMSFDLIEPANETEVPAVMAGSDVYRSVRLAANDVVSWTNDVFSVRKENARGDADHLAAVLRAASGGGWDDAVARATAMVADLTRDFTEACQDLRAVLPVFALTPAETATVEESLDDLATWISGSLEWHRWSPRYREVAATAPGSTPPYVERHLV
jgi:hypothetical protein